MESELNKEKEEIFNQIVTGAIVFKTTYGEYLDFIDKSGAMVKILYQKKSFNPSKKLIVQVVESE